MKDKTEKPNILCIMLDHQLFYKHPYKNGPDLKRSAYENFCASAFEFTNAFSVNPLCGPARRSILNGLYPHNHNHVRNGLHTPFTEETYYDSLLKNGYDCYYFGKWHAGPGTAEDLGAKGFSPPDYSCPYPYDDYKNYLTRYNLPHPAAEVEFTESDFHLFGDGKETDLTKVENLFSLTFGKFKGPKEAHESYYLAGRAIETLKELKGGDKPFCLRVDFWGPHQPYFPTQEFLDMYDEADFDYYGSFFDDLKNKPPIYRFEAGRSLSKNNEIILPNPLTKERWQKMMKYAYAHNTMCDLAAGSILNALKSLGLDGNTYVIWSADHGDGLGAHGGHLDKNCYLSEEVIRIPLAVRNPFDKNAQNKKVCAPVSNFDIAPTIAEMSGGRFKNKTDARSLLPYIIKEKATEREYFVSTTHGHFYKHNGRCVSYKNFRYIENKDMIEELYDLDKDPYQMKNLYNSAEYEEIKNKLKNRLFEWKKEFKDKEFN